MADIKNNYPIVYIKGLNSRKTGNVFKGNMYGNYPFVSSPQIYKFSGNKKIKWIFNLTDNDFFIIKEELFKVTEDNSTVIIKNIKYKNEKLFYDIENNEII